MLECALLRPYTPDERLIVARKTTKYCHPKKVKAMEKQQHKLIADISIELRESLNGMRVDRKELVSFSGLPVMPYAFFPGGNGLYEGVNSRFRGPGGTLILGSNFGCRREFVDDAGNLITKDERGNRTWAPLLMRLRSSGIPANECFFTNAWPFLHLGQGNLTKGLIKVWLRDPALMALCLQFARLTFDKIKPNLVIALGTGPAAFLSHMWPLALHRWRGYSFDCIDDLPIARVTTEDHSAICVAITHPSMWNSAHRRPPYQGPEGEILLLAEARKRAEVQSPKPISTSPDELASSVPFLIVPQKSKEAVVPIRTGTRRGKGLHFKFEEAFESHVGRVFSRREMKRILQEMFPGFPDGSVVPTDHAEPSSDHVNQCRKCANPDFRIFDTLADNRAGLGAARYRVRDYKPCQGE